MNLKSLLCAAALVFAASTGAHADVVNLTYAASEVLFPGPLPLNAAHLQITTGSTLNSYGGYEITGVSGDVDGDTITGLQPTLGPALPWYPDALASCLKWCSVDQTYFPDGPFLSFYGFSFESDSALYNLFYNGDGEYGLVSVAANEAPADPYDPNLLPPASLSGTGGTLAVPEPGTWSLLILGIGLLGLSLRSRRASLPLAA